MLSPLCLRFPVPLLRSMSFRLSDLKRTRKARHRLQRADQRRKTPLNRCLISPKRVLWIQGFFPCIPTRLLGKVGSSFPIQCSRRSLFTFLTSMTESHNRVLHEAAIATRKSFHFTSISTALKSMRRTQIITSTHVSACSSFFSQHQHSHFG